MSSTIDHAAIVKRVAEEETNKFLDSNFGQLDISGCRSLLKPPSDEESLPDQRFARLDDRGVGLGASALKAGIEELLHDPATVEEVVRSSGDPDVLREYQHNQAEQISREFLRINPAYYRCRENWDKIVQTLAYNALGWAEDEADVEDAQDELIARGLWTLGNLTAAFNALSRAGVLVVRPDQPRQLTQHQRRAIALQAGSGDVEGAISRYLLLRAPEDAAEAFMQAPTLQDALEEIADPALARIVNEAVWFCWEQGRPGYSPTAERRRFMKDYIAGRIPTARLLDEAWNACQAEEKDIMRASVLGQITNEEGPGEPNLEELNDSEVDRLYHATMKKIAVDSHKGGLHE